jgi:hypothetical protein
MKVLSVWHGDGMHFVRPPAQARGRYSRATGWIAHLRSRVPPGHRLDTIVCSERHYPSNRLRCVLDRQLTCRPLLTRRNSVAVAANRARGPDWIFPQAVPVAARHEAMVRGSAHQSRCLGVGRQDRAGRGQFGHLRALRSSVQLRQGHTHSVLRRACLSTKPRRVHPSVPHVQGSAGTRVALGRSARRAGGTGSGAGKDHGRRRKGYAGGKAATGNPQSALSRASGRFPAAAHAQADRRGRRSGCCSASLAT